MKVHRGMEQRCNSTLVEGRDQPHNVATLSMGKEILTVRAQEVGCAPELVWALRRRENLCLHHE